MEAASQATVSKSDATPQMSRRTALQLMAKSLAMLGLAPEIPLASVSMKAESPAAFVSELWSLRPQLLRFLHCNSMLQSADGFERAFFDEESKAWLFRVPNGDDRGLSSEDNIVFLNFRVYGIFASLAEGREAPLFPRFDSLQSFYHRCLPFAAVDEKYYLDEMKSGDKGLFEPAVFERWLSTETSPAKKQRLQEAFNSRAELYQAFAGHPDTLSYLRSTYRGFDTKPALLREGLTQHHFNGFAMHLEKALWLRKYMRDLLQDLCENHPEAECMEVINAFAQEPDKALCLKGLKEKAAYWKLRADIIECGPDSPGSLNEKAHREEERLSSQGVQIRHRLPMPLAEIPLESLLRIRSATHDIALRWTAVDSRILNATIETPDEDFELRRPQLRDLEFLSRSPADGATAVCLRKSSIPRRSGEDSIVEILKNANKTREP